MPGCELSKGTNTMNYSILIKGEGPVGTGEEDTSADLLAGDLVNLLQAGGHAVEHASLESEGGLVLLLQGSVTKHPEAPDVPKKKMGARARVNPPPAPDAAPVPHETSPEEGGAAVEPTPDREQEAGAPA